jgi:hypothetical protein
MENLKKPAAENKSSEKKAYHPPQFVQYGNIAKLTHNNPGPNAGDAMGMMTTPCL